MPTPKRQLLELLYDGDLPGDVHTFLAADMSWREIAERVSARTGVTVSHESMRQWYGDTASVAS